MKREQTFNRLEEEEIMERTKRALTALLVVAACLFLVRSATADENPYDDTRGGFDEIVRGTGEATTLRIHQGCTFGAVKGRFERQFRLATGRELTPLSLQAIEQNQGTMLPVCLSEKPTGQPKIGRPGHTEVWNGCPETRQSAWLQAGTVVTIPRQAVKIETYAERQVRFAASTTCLETLVKSGGADTACLGAISGAEKLKARLAAAPTTGGIPAKNGDEISSAGAPKGAPSATAHASASNGLGTKEEVTVGSFEKLPHGSFSPSWQWKLALALSIFAGFVACYLAFAVTFVLGIEQGKQGPALLTDRLVTDIVRLSRESADSQNRHAELERQLTGAYTCLFGLATVAGAQNLLQMKLGDTEGTLHARLLEKLPQVVRELHGKAQTADAALSARDIAEGVASQARENAQAQHDQAIQASWENTCRAQEEAQQARTERDAANTRYAEIRNEMEELRGQLQSTQASSSATQSSNGSPRAQLWACVEALLPTDGSSLARYTLKLPHSNGTAAVENKMNVLAFRLDLDELPDVVRDRLLGTQRLKSTTTLGLLLTVDLRTALAVA